MRWCNVIMVWTGVWLALFSQTPWMLAAQEVQKAAAVAAVSDKSRALPDLADLIPLEASLPGRFARLQQQQGSLVDLPEIKELLATISTVLGGNTAQLQRLQAVKGYGYYQLKALRFSIKRQDEAIAKVSATLTGALRQVGVWRTVWIAEKEQWKSWQSSGLRDAPLEEVKQTFASAHRTIDTALDLLEQQITPLLAAQQQARDLQVRNDVLAANVDGIIADMSESAAPPPMLSSRYAAQFDSWLWYDLRTGLGEVPWPDSRFIAHQGWLMLLQGVLSLVVMLFIFRHRRQLEQSAHWRFAARRPVAAGCFVGAVPVFVLYEFSLLTFQFAYTVILGIAFARLLGELLPAGWKKQLIYASVTLMLATRLLQALNPPEPLVRLYILLAALVGLVSFLRWAVRSGRDGDAWLYPWALRLGACVFGVILVLELSGQANLADNLLVSSIRLLLGILMLGLFRHLVHAGLEWAIGRAPARGLEILRKDTTTLVRWLGLLADVLIGFLLLSFLLVVFGAYDSPLGVLTGLMGIGLPMGVYQITVGHIVAAITIFFGFLIVSGILQSLLLGSVLAKSSLETGVQFAIARLAHYVVVFIGFVVALSILGFEFTRLTIVLSALGVGIGFGLQAIVNNFICGLILLFERPVRVGDTIEISGQWAQIRKIGLRATTVQTFDQADVILPNSDLINQPVTNWTLTNRQARVLIPVGVAYGSDVPLVMQTLRACAAENVSVTNTRDAMVLFRQFGDSSLNFELRVWIRNVDERLSTISELHQDIDRRFRAAGIEIAFPQRDLHIRSVDTAADSGFDLPPQPDEHGK